MPLGLKSRVALNRVKLLAKVHHKRKLGAFFMSSEGPPIPKGIIGIPPSSTCPPHRALPSAKRV